MVKGGLSSTNEVRLRLKKAFQIIFYNFKDFPLIAISPLGLVAT